MKICIDPGHGGIDKANGAPDGSYKEHEFTLDMALRLRALLAPHMTVIITRTADETVELSTRASIANLAAAELYLSLHSNAAKSNGAWNSARGLCVYSYATGASAARNRLARALLNSFQKSGILLFQNPMQYAKFAVLSGTNMPAVLIEYAFHDNREDSQKLLDPAWRQAAALATAQGVCDYLGIEFSAAAAPPLPAPEPPPAIYRVQLGAFSARENAEGLRAELIAKGYSAIVVETTK